MGKVVQVEKEDRDESRPILGAGVTEYPQRSANKDGAPEKIADPEILAQVAQLLSNVY
jgi:hypothetical protein